MASGTVKWFNSNKGYGFITSDQGGNDIFVHITALEAAGLHTLQEGQRLNYEVTLSKGRESADKLQLIG